MKGKYKQEKHKDYFEAIIQLRPLDKPLYDWVKTDIENNKVGIAKEQVTKYGFDIYIDSNKYAMALGKKLKRRFDGVVKLSRTLHTQHHMTSKELFRVTVLFRLNERKSGEAL